MKLSATALAPLMFCSVLAGCETTRVAVPLKPDPARLQCAGVEKRPTISGEYQIDWSKVTTVPEARAEHDAYVRSVRTREGIVAGYIVELEGKLFVCSNNAAWLRDFFRELPSG